jgi:lipoyl(octanoyl) transferase
MNPLFLRLDAYNITYETALKEMEQWPKENNHGLLWILEHEPVITLGKSGTDQDILGTHIPVVYTSRGGQATYHGPGQIIIYPVINLKNCSMNLTDYRNDLNTWIFHFLSIFGLEMLWLDPPEPGFWIRDPNTKMITKWGFIGLRVHQGWVSHGCCLNIMKECLKGFQDIVPCGQKKDSLLRNISCLQDLLEAYHPQCMHLPLKRHEVLNFLIQTCPWTLQKE